MQVNSNAWLANSSYPDYEGWLYSSSFSVQRDCQEMEERSLGLFWVTIKWPGCQAKFKMVASNFKHVWSSFSKG